MKTADPKQEATASMERLVDALVTTSFVTMAHVSRIGAEHDLSLSLTRVLGILWDRRLRMNELASYLGLEKQTMSGLIARAEKRGLVARAPNEEDRRATDVFLTSEGKKLVRRIRAQGREALGPLVEGLEVSERAELVKLLQRILTAGEGSGEG